LVADDTDIDPYPLLASHPLGYRSVDRTTPRFVTHAAIRAASQVRPRDAAWFVRAASGL